MKNDINNFDTTTPDASAAHASSSTPTCDYGEQLVAYLYGETTAAEAKNFAAHLVSCAACQTDADEFAFVRRDVATWRQTMPEFAVSQSPEFRATLAALVASSAPHATINEVTANEVTTDEASNKTIEQRTGASLASPINNRTAWTALREFFQLCPWWLQIGGALTAIAVCLLATLAVFNTDVRWTQNDFAFQTGLTPRAISYIAQPPTDAPDEAAVTRIINARLEAELARRIAEETGATKEIATNDKATDDIASASVNAPKTVSLDAANSIGKTRNARILRRANPAPRERRLTTTDVSPNDADVPRLYDLLADAD